LNRAIVNSIRYGRIGFPPWPPKTPYFSYTYGQRRFCGFYSFEDHVPANHLSRGINQFFDLTDLRAYLAPFYSHTGRPSIDPELMIRMLIVGYCFGIRSERRLCEEVHLNLAYRWFCRLGLEDAVPEHSTFSKNRHGRFRESDAFRHVFETVLQRCMNEGLVGGEGFAIDASVVKADAARAGGVPGAAIDYRALGPAQASRAVREYLEGIEGEGRPEMMRKNISVTDPAAEWTCAPGGPAFFAYSTNYLIDVRDGVIVDVEATSAHRTKEVDATQTMIDRVERRFGIKPTRLIGDMAYGTADLLGWMVTIKLSNRTCRCGTGLNAQTTRCPAATFSGTNNAMNTAARKGGCCAPIGAHSRTRAPALPKPTRLFISPGNPIARVAR
jgi:transposase